MISFRLTTLLCALLVLPLAEGAEVRCCLDCDTSTDCSDVGDYLGEGINESAETFCEDTLSAVYDETYSVCPDGTGNNPGAGEEMCCDPYKECGEGRRQVVIVVCH